MALLALLAKIPSSSTAFFRATNRLRVSRADTNARFGVRSQDSDRMVIASEAVKPQIILDFG